MSTPLTPLETAVDEMAHHQWPAGVSLHDVVVEVVRRYANEGSTRDESAAVVAHVQSAIDAAFSDPGIGSFDMTSSATRESDRYALGEPDVETILQ